MKAVRSLALLAALAFAGPAFAQTYPNKPIKMIVPFAAGGPTDVIARLIAQKLSETLGPAGLCREHSRRRRQYRHRHGGARAGRRLHHPGREHGLHRQSEPLLRRCRTTIRTSRRSRLVAASPNVVSVHPSFPAKSIKELIALVKANPGKYSYAQPATGSTPHLAGELFKLRYGLDLSMVPFNSAAPRHELDASAATRRSRSRRCRRRSPTSRTASCAGLRCWPPSATPGCPTCRPWRKPACPIRNPTR